MNELNKWLKTHRKRCGMERTEAVIKIVEYCRAFSEKRYICRQKHSCIKNKL